MKDLNFACRQLEKNPGFTTAAVIAVAPVADFRQRRRRRGKHGIPFSPLTEAERNKPFTKDEKPFQSRGLKGRQKGGCEQVNRNQGEEKLTTASRGSIHVPFAGRRNPTSERFVAAIGIYGVLAYSVSQRTRELGLRMALGAQQSDILRLLIGQGTTFAILGIAFGLAGAFALTRVMRTLLFEVEPSDPLSFVTVSLLLLAVALLACWLPARRAARVHPMEALRCE